MQLTFQIVKISIFMALAETFFNIDHVYINFHNYIILEKLN